MMPALRVKYVLTAQYVKVAAIALIFIGVCTMLLLTNVATPALAMSPLAEDPQPQPGSTTHLAGVSQGVTVNITDTTNAFTEGQTLEDRPAFPLQNASAPVVTASGDAQDATVETIKIQVRYDASLTGGGNGFYTKTETLAAKEISGTSGTLETTVDIRSIFEKKNQLENEFGSGATVTPTVESVITYRYTSATGEMRTGTASVGGELTSSGALFSLPTGTDQRRHETGTPATDSTSSFGNAAIGTVGGAFILLFGTSLFIGRRNGRKKLAQRIEVKRYDEWVTEIGSYTPRGETNIVKVQALAGLVKLAIDINERVLYTPNLEEYIVMDGNTMYKYRSEDPHRDEGPEFDADGSPKTPSSPEEDTPHEPADPDPETGSENDPESDR